MTAPKILSPEQFEDWREVWGNTSHGVEILRHIAALEAELKDARWYTERAGESAQSFVALAEQKEKELAEAKAELATMTLRAEDGARGVKYCRECIDGLEGELREAEAEIARLKELAEYADACALEREGRE